MHALDTRTFLRSRTIVTVLFAMLMFCSGCARQESTETAMSSSAAESQDEQVNAQVPSVELARSSNQHGIQPQVSRAEAFVAEAFVAEAVVAEPSVANVPLRSDGYQPFEARGSGASGTAYPKASARAVPQTSAVRSTAARAASPQAMAVQAPSSMLSTAAPASEDVFAQMPAGASRNVEQGFATVQVFYATDRKRGALPLSAYAVTGQKQSFMMIGGVSMILFAFAALAWLLGRGRTAFMSGLAGCGAGVVAAAFVMLGHANIEKHGVTYGRDRGVFTRGICEVTVPDSHQRGMVERPSLLRFEIQEDQREHIVLISATELAQSDFQRRLSDTIAQSPEADLLVFIHGYNVDFESAVQRTAQIAVDLPFEGVPVCYSWPSQGTLVGYPIDETNSAWTTTHLREFLLELARDSGAKSINVVAHSMGNRAMTSAIQQITWQLPPNSDKPFDQIVLAAPDVDADQFRRDLGPPLAAVAQQVTLYASSADQALIASKRVHGYPRAGESGTNLVFVPGIDTIDVSGIDMSLLGHSYYGDNQSMLRDLYEVVRGRLQAENRGLLIPKQLGTVKYWQLAQQNGNTNVR